MPAAFNMRDKWPHCPHLINTATFPWPRVLATDLISKVPRLHAVPFSSFILTDLLIRFCTNSKSKF
jgi:hypothetical protein